MEMVLTKMRCEMFFNDEDVGGGGGGGGVGGGRTKCQPDKMPTGHNANQRLAFCPDFFLWLAFCPPQLFGWHFVRTILTSFGILSES